VAAYYTCRAVVHLSRSAARSDDHGDITHYRNLTACLGCTLRLRCKPEKIKRLKRWKREALLDVMQSRVGRLPDDMGLRRRTVEQVCGTLKSWAGGAHFLTRTLK
jgi:hypothetical protein